MTRARVLWLFSVLALAATAEPADVQVKTWLSRTAVWPGDRVSYTVELVCPPNVDVVLDDLLPDKLSLTGLEVLSSERERSVSGSGGVTYRVRYLLTTYEVAVPTLRIGELLLRYSVRRPSQRSEDAVPADQVRVTGATLALRSTLPDELAAVAVRDLREATRLPAALEYARPVGLGLLLVSAAPVALWAAALVRRVRAKREQRRARQRESAGLTRGALEELRAVDASNDAARRAGYDRLDALLRQQLAIAKSLPARALTAAEITARLEKNEEPLATRGLADALLDCERARYAPAALLPAPERFRAAVQVLEELLAGASR